MQSYRYLMPTEVVFETGGLDRLGALCAGLGKRPLIVTGRHAARATGLLDRVLKQFPDAAVYDAVEENPTTLNCDAGGEYCRDAGCDFVIALGGGSAMDAAKAIAALAPRPVTCTELLDAPSLPEGVLPIVAIPTTAGTGSEVTPYAVLVDPDRHAKRTLRGHALFPRFALLDPSITVSLPRDITAATGFDALSQGMEGFLSLRATPFGDILALETCRLVKRCLSQALDRPGNLDARAAMLQAAMLSGCVIAQSGTTLVHGMGYYLTLHCGLAHGLANALLLGPVFVWNAHIAPEKVAALAGALGFPGPARPEAAAANISRALYSLFETAGISPAAREHGVPESRLGPWAEDIITDKPRFKNQIGALNTEDVYGLFHAAYTAHWLEVGPIPD